MRLQRSIGDLQMDSSRRGSTSARRSFFKRKKHSRSSSRDSKELASFSDASLNSYTETTPMHDEPPPHSYIRVERLDCKYGCLDIISVKKSEVFLSVRP